MKHFLTLLLAVVSIQVFAQVPKFVKLEANDPLIGTWEWVKDPTGSPYSPVVETEFIFIRFAPTDSLSMGAIEKNESKGYLGTGYFTAYSNGSIVFGTLSGCSNPSNNGKSFRFEYRVTGNELVIIVKGEEIFYKRK